MTITKYKKEFDAKEPIDTAGMNINFCKNTNYFVYIHLDPENLFIGNLDIRLLKDKNENVATSICDSQVLEITH